MKNENNWRNDFSVEYNLIKKAIARENIKQTIKTIGTAALFMWCSYGFMYAIVYTTHFILDY